MADKYDAFLDTEDAKLDAFLDAEPATASVKPSVKVPTQTPSMVQKLFADMKQMPQWVEDLAAKAPNIPQPVVNVAAGMLPGFLENAPRVQNVATEDGWRTLGRVLKPAETLLGMKAAQAVTALPKIAQASKAMQSAAAGAAGGAVGGTLSEDPIMGALNGTALGGVLGLAFRPVERVADETYRLVATWKAGERGQVINWLNKVLPDPQLKQQAIKELNNLSAIVPGEQVTSGLAAVSGVQPIPVLKAIEEQARRSVVASPKFAAADAASEAARVKPVEDIAVQGRRFFDPSTGRAELSQAEALRKQVTDPLFAKANPDLVRISPELQKVLGEAQVALPEARATASIAQAQANMVAGGRPTAVGVAEAGYMPKPFNQFGTLANEPFVPRDPAQSVAALQRVKDELNKKINDIAQATDTPTVVLRNQLVDARRLLTNAMKSQSGSYAVANQIFKNFSAPQNQADVAEQLLKALRTPAGGERASAFLGAMEEAPRTLKRSGLPMFSDIREVMTPEQTGMMGKVAESLKREEAYKRLTAPNLPAMKSPAEELLDVIPAIISRPVAFVRKFLGKAGAETDTAAQRLLYEAATDPKKLAQLLAELPPDARQAIVQWTKANRAGLMGGDVSVLMSNILTDNQPKGMLEAQP